VSKTVLIGVLLTIAGLAGADEPPVRDPMRPFGGAGAAAGGAAAVAGRPRFALTGVLIAPSRRVAILNGKPYTPGAVVDGAEIVAIEPGAVRLREQGAEVVISLALRDQAQPQLVGDTAP
jgi:hypothetical protein